MIVDAVRQRLLKGIGANLYGQVIVAFTQFAGVPILLHAWGIHTYGQWLILFAIPGYLSMTDLGFSVSAANDMTAQVARGNRGEALAVFQSINALIVGTSVTVFIVTTTLVWTLPLGKWLHLGTLSPDAVRFVLLLLCTDVLIKLYDGINHAGFRANGEYALHTAITNTTPFVQQVVVWTIALAGYDPLVAAMGYFVVRIIVVPSTAIFLAARHRWLKFGFSNGNLGELRRLIRPALANLAMPLAQSFNIQGMVLAVAFTLGPTAVVVFSTTRTLTRIVLQAVAVVSHAAEPEFASLSGRQDTGLIRSLYVQTMRISLWLAIAAITGLAVAGGPFLKLWTHGAVSLNFFLFVPLLLTVLSSAIWNQALAMLKATNQHLTAAVWFATSTGSAVLIALISLHFTHFIGFAGAALLVTDSAFCLFVLHACSEHFGFSIVSGMREALNPRPLLVILRRRIRLA